jgi:long-chain acyl-CoA synthetase
VAQARADGTGGSTVAALVAATLGRHGSADAIIEESGARISFDQLRDRVWRLASALTDGLGLKRGDRVGVLADNCAEYIELDFACALTGLAKVPLYVRNAPSEHVYMIEDADVDVVVLEPRFAAPVANALGGAGELRAGLVVLDRAGERAEVDGARSYEALLADARAVAPDHTLVSPTDPYQVRYTGGTTGRPKGALTDQGAMLTAILGNLQLHSYENSVGVGDVFAHVMGFSHVGSFLIAAFSWAGVAHLPMKKFDPERFLANTSEHRVSLSMMAPTMIGMMLDDPSWLKRYDASSLKTITYGGEPMPLRMIDQALESFGSAFAQVYGSTEAPSLTTLLPKRDHLSRDEALLRSCGFAMPWVDIQVLGDDDEIMPVGELGELGVRGRSVLTEYVNKPEATAAALANGWYHTGDVGYRDERGYLYLVDRKSDLIISGGFNIYPAEVESALMTHPDIVECAVIGTPHERWGETVTAVITTRPSASLSLADVQAHCERHLGSYKKPRRARVSNAPLPRSEHGKVLRRELRRDFMELPYEEERRRPA